MECGGRRNDVLGGTRILQNKWHKETLWSHTCACPDACSLYSQPNSLRGSSDAASCYQSTVATCFGILPVCGYLHVFLLSAGSVSDSTALQRGRNLTSIALSEL